MLVGGSVVIAGGIIVAVGATAELRAAYPDATVVDVTDCVVTPGMVNAHQHLTGDPLVRSCIPDLISSGESIFEWAVPIHAQHTADDDEVVGDARAPSNVCATASRQSSKRARWLTPIEWRRR